MTCGFYPPAMKIKRRLHRPCSARIVCLNAAAIGTLMLAPLPCWRFGESFRLAEAQLKSPLVYGEFDRQAPAVSVGFTFGARMRLVVNLGQMLKIEVGVHLRRSDAAVSEQFLDRAQVTRGLQEV